jgi:formate hydrogenlyase subunit 6/NADH:ubiquinone oxidoreductase subunit I
MSAAIYYFSGTGNSLTVARRIAAHTKGELIPIASAAAKDTVNGEADAIGIVFPNYYGRPPLIVERFAGTLENLGGKYVFAVCTYGHGGVRALRALQRVIRARGGKLASRFGIHMPQNAFFKPCENHRKIFKIMEKRARIIGKKVAQRRKGRFVSTYFLHTIEFPLRMLFKPLILKSMRDISHSPPGSTWEEIIHAADKSFSAGDACDSCGICARVCPVKNINLAEGKPIWLHRCENCLACYDWCPKEAIQGKIVSKGYHYRHPDATAKDFIMR